MRDSEKKSYPSKSEIKEFWEWCGFSLYEDTEGEWKSCFYWHNPPDTEEWGATWLPPIDLNNLFKYAVSQSKMDTLWIINNLGSPIPKIEY